MRRGDQAPRAFQAPVDVHASADGQVYMFKRRSAESALCSEEEEMSSLELRSYHSHPNHSTTQVLERELQPGDNLNKLALQYGCQVADIKRLNNLIQEQDLFALKTIKIPVQKHSFLTEVHPTQDAPPSSPDALPPSPEEDSPTAPTHVREVAHFLMELDNDMERLIQSTEQDDDELLEVRDKRDRRSHRKQGGKGVKGHGADWGINWWNAVIAMLLVGIVLPLFYIIYFKTRPLVHTLTNSTAPVGGTQGPVQEPG
ncbi:lysM and putative peptidoglycan-binding domain-containing protein 4 [Boleophthalmus pectinirostris]|uniref:lysM and putative peptidoglycan-binding domain-containing protein 4 n=1 Tax=Boleophthalmus pectinirostris TaxID=150288 RepID=UPI000A1C5518|nr:lysM and putative peptidoglycan-binding domain-containing protein 4 [Boleophthalmus pectinirostris]XP_055012013.1 lysM and putative peptidoglycan-binding domain-containing protein 4 [Boleophthalmus pectinirostris]